MAGTAVNFLLHTMGSLLLQEASLLGGLRSSLVDIKLELQSIQSFLKDADRKRDSNEEVKTWVGQVRDAAYDVEDIIEEFMYRTAKSDAKGIRGALYNTIPSPKCCFYNHQIATQLQEIKSNIVEISARGKRYGFEVEGAISKPNKDRKLAPFVPDNEIVGIEDNKNAMIKWLIDEEPARMVLSVLGIGGLGKTTLVTKAYRSDQSKNHFQCRAWITVSQSYNEEELLRSIIKEFYKSSGVTTPKDIGEMDYTALVDALITFLQQKRYMIVLDDVWDTNVWQHVNCALPDCGCSSRIIITTRNEDVSSSLGVGSNDFKLRPLGPTDAWALFCNRAFWNCAGKSCPRKLKPYAQRLVEKCEGLPLAIVAIGGLMSLKEKTALEWKKVEDSLNWELSNNPNLKTMKNLLLHSFNDLPYHLKQCFLYCSVFPEDYVIRRKRLIRLWVAEGFVKARKGLTFEEVAETYLKELICRSMLQTMEIDDVRKTKLFRMHDIMRELALAIGTEENFCMIYSGEEATQDGKARRLSIQNWSKKIPKGTSMTHLRSFFWFARDVFSSSSFNSMIPAFRLLRVLELRGSWIESVPDELTDLFNLRYLSLRNTNVKVLPKSLEKLRNLQTLDLRNSKVEKLPIEVERLKNLRHIYFYRYSKQSSFNYFDGIQVPTGICNLKFLQTLVSVEANDEIVRQVGNLNQLRKFGTMKVKEANGIQLCTSIEKMKRLLYLDVMAANEEESLHLESMSTPPPLLQELSLSGHMEMLPHWIASLENLTYLNLFWSRTRNNLFSSFRTFANLERLKLHRAYEGHKLCFHAGCFPKLELLSLIELTFLHSIVIDKGAMPCLRELNLINCGELKMLPQGIEYLMDLQELLLEDMPKELSERIQGDDFPKVQHIPRVRIY